MVRVTPNCRKVLAFICLGTIFNSVIAIMTFPDTGIYSLFPHEDLRTGKRRLRFEDDYPDNQRDRYQSGRPPPPPQPPLPPPRDRDDFPRPGGGSPSSEPLVDILRPTSQGLRSGGGDDRPNIFRDRETLYYNHRSPRVQFRDDERRVYGYGKRYYHDELPPPLDDNPSRETNLIRPSPIDYSREQGDRRYLPNNNYAYQPEAKLPPGARDRDDDTSREKTRIHIFTPHHFGRNNYHSYRQPDGPDKVTPPNEGAFLNHDEYLAFHTKLALDTLDKEKKKLEDAHKKLFFPSSSSSTPSTGAKAIHSSLVPPNFSKEVTVIQEDEDHHGSNNHGAGGNSNESGGSDSCEEDDDNNNNGKNSFGTSTTRPQGLGAGRAPHNSEERRKFNSNSNPGSITAGSSSSSSSPGPGGTSATITTPSSSHTSLFLGNNEPSSNSPPDNNKLPSTETGFLPIVPFHLQGVNKPTATILKIDPNQDRLSPSYRPSTTNSVHRVTGVMTTTTPSSSSTTFKASTGFNLPPSTLLSTSFNLEKNRTINTTTVTSTTTARGIPSSATAAAADFGNTVKFQHKTPATLLTLSPQPSSPASFVFSPNQLQTSVSSSLISGNAESPSVFVDSKEVSGYFTAFNATGELPGDQMMIYVERVKGNNKRKKTHQHHRQSSSSNERNSTFHNSISSSNSSKSFSSSSSQIESSVKIHHHHQDFSTTLAHPNELNGTTTAEFVTESPDLLVTTGHGVNAGVVSKVHAHISHCPKLYGPVEIICDVHVRDRHGNPNPYLTVGWVRKYYNETRPDKVVAVNKSLAYEEEFHDKFNVTLAPGVYPMLRSVLIIKEVTVPDCGNYECEVFDGVSTHKSETLVFLCH